MSDLFAEVVPFTGEMMPQEAAPAAPAAMIDIAGQREVAEVQAAIVIAKRYPRNQAKAVDRVMVACQRPSLAEKATYSYARGGTDISGPSIRLAEAIIQQWGNAQYGFKELSNDLGESVVEAYAWDLETNNRPSITFTVKHKRFTKKGSYELSDPRDIYELMANQGARRLRSCLLKILPGDVVDAAVAECDKTLRAKADLTPVGLGKVLEAFKPLGVTQAMIEKRIQRKFEAITAAQVVNLKKIYNSINDGMSIVDDWFETVIVAAPVEAAPAPAPEPAPEVTREAPAPEGAAFSATVQGMKEIDPVATPPAQEAPKKTADMPAAPEQREAISNWEAKFPGTPAEFLAICKLPADFNWAKLTFGQAKAVLTSLTKYAKKQEAAPKVAPLPINDMVAPAQAPAKTAPVAISMEQVDEIERLCREKNMPVKSLLAACGLSPDLPLIELTEDGGKMLIAELKKL